MGRIKLPEFKENEQITSDQFNEVNDAFQQFTVNGENLANEAINESMVEDESAFGSVQSAGVTVLNIDPVSSSDTTNWRESRRNWMFSATSSRGAITVPTITKDDNVLVRASCRLKIPDVGAKTFFSGRTPIVKLMLAYRTNVDETTGDDTGWIFLNETCQEFRMAFSTKIPSDSSLSELTAIQSGATIEGLPLGSPYITLWGDRGLMGLTSTTRERDVDSTGFRKVHRDTTDPSETSESRYSLGFRDHNSLHGDFSYTTGYLFNTNTDITNVQFALWGSFYGFDPGGGNSSAGTTGKIRGCLKPVFEKFELRDFNIYGYKIKNSRT
jgi:hypothetical protein